MAELLRRSNFANSRLDILKQSDYNRQYEKAMSMLKYLITLQREDVTG